MILPRRPRVSMGVLVGPSRSAWVSSDAVAFLRLTELSAERLELGLVAGRPVPAFRGWIIYICLAFVCLLCFLISVVLWVYTGYVLVWF